MSKFALNKMECIKGKQSFCKLVIDEICPFDTFIENLEEQYKAEIGAIMLYMEAVAQQQSLPSSKFRELKGKKNDEKEYEFKSKHLRVYAIRQKGGKIIVMGGYKNSQKKDIATFRALKKQYIESITQNKQNEKNRK